MCTEASLKNDYVTVSHYAPDGSKTFDAYGGNQNEFFIDSEHSPMSDRIIRNGGCALIALCDCTLYLSQRVSISADEYLSYVREFSDKHLRPVSVVDILRKLVPQRLASDGKIINLAAKFTKSTYTLGIFYFKLCNVFNKLYRSRGLRMYRIALNGLSVKRIKKSVTASLKDDIPAILLLGYGSHAKAQRKDNGAICEIGWHYMTVTGIRCESETRTVIVLSSWGKRMEAVLEELSHDSGLMGSVLLIKKVNKEA